MAFPWQPAGRYSQNIQNIHRQVPTPFTTFSLKTGRVAQQHLNKFSLLRVSEFCIIRRGTRRSVYCVVSGLTAAD